MEDRLRQGSARFSPLADSGILGIAFTDVTGAVRDANDAYLRMLGFSREDLAAGRIHCAAVTPPEWNDVDGVAIRQLQTVGATTPWEKEIYRKDGTRVPVLVGVAMLGTFDCIAFVADLSAQKRAEGALRPTEEQRRQAQKMEAIGRLAGGVAHDFNNLLTVILGYSQLASAGLSPGDPLFTALSEVQKAAERATDLTRQLLGAGRREVARPAVVDLNEMLRGLEPLLRRLLGEGVELTLVLGARVGRIRVETGQLEQVVMNLVVNARDAMPKGGKLRIETANVTLDEGHAAEHTGSVAGPHVTLVVADTGCGMDAATRARAFEPFFTTKKLGKGTGLGLSTVRGIMEQSGGSVEVRSEPGLGATFRVCFPRAEAEVDPVTPRPTVDATGLHGSGTILLVEDDEAVRTLVAEVLRRFGYQVLGAQSARDAIVVSERHASSIDLLLTDVAMPGASGSVLADQLRLRRPAMRVLYITGCADDSVVRNGVHDADVSFLQKPLAAETLARTVREVLGAVRRRS